MSQVIVKVPLGVALQWNLEDQLSEATEEAGIAFDGGEQMGDEEWLFFLDTTPTDVQKFLQAQLPTSGVKVTVTRANEITVNVAEQPWVVETINDEEDPYARAFNASLKRLNASAEWREWWSHTDYTQLFIQQYHDPQGSIGFDAGQFHGRTLPGMEGKLLISAGVNLEDGDPLDNLRVIMDRLADYLGRPAPAIA
jgi:hypothetical protein